MPEWLETWLEGAEWRVILAAGVIVFGGLAVVCLLLWAMSPYWP